MDVVPSRPSVDMAAGNDPNNVCSTSTSTSGQALVSPTRAGAAGASFAAGEAANDKTAQKLLKKGKVQDPSQEFVAILATRIEELEKSGSTSPAEREAAKVRRRQLKEVQKFCSERANSVEDRVAYIQLRYQQQVSDLTKMERQFLEAQKELDSVVKERDRVQTELKKSNTLRDKLEELCRQLQREAREGAEEGRRRSEAELSERQALQLKFSAAINDVTTKMDQHQSERLKQLSENDALRGKLGEFLEQFELQQKHFTATLHAKDLEQQLAAARLEQQTQVAAQLALKADLLQQSNDKLSESHEVILKELEHAAASQQQQGALLVSNRELKGQLEHYHTRFGEFQSTLTKSNQMFDKLKGELESHAKARLSLTKERDELRRKASSSDAVMIGMLEEKTALKKQVEKLATRASAPGGPDECARLLAQRDRLEGLCRTLQAQVKAANAAAAATAAPAAAAAAAATTPASSLPPLVADGTPADSAVPPAAADAAGVAAEEAGGAGGESDGAGEGGGGPASAHDTTVAAVALEAAAAATGVAENGVAPPSPSPLQQEVPPTGC